MARSLLGGALYVTLVAVFALGIGAIVRSTAGRDCRRSRGSSLSSRRCLDILPASWNDSISKYLPSEAGRQLFSLHQGVHALSPLWGGLLLVGYCALVIGAAAVLLVRRDA